MPLGNRQYLGKMYDELQSAIASNSVCSDVCSYLYYAAVQIACQPCLHDKTAPSLPNTT